MGRIVALDVGRKRTGIAVTDPLQLVANGVTTLPTYEVADFLVRYVSNEDVELIVVGQPRTVRNEPSEATTYIIPLVNRLRRVLPNIPLTHHDERFTSKLAFRAMIDAGLPRMKRRDKALVDRVSATIILQSYLQAREMAKML